MFLVAVTGSIATGKSTCSSIFMNKYGIQVIDSDKVARKVLEPGRKAWKGVLNVFGPDILIKETNEINRAVLGAIIFNNPEKRKQLNQITHPEIYKEICWMLVWYFIRGFQFVIIESPLLFETGIWTKYVHKIIVVTCEDDIQLQRLMDRSQKMESECKAMINAQMSQNEKAKRADFIIENSSNLADTEEQVDKIYNILIKSNAHWKIRFYLALIGVGSTTVVGLLYLFLKRWIFYKHIRD